MLVRRIGSQSRRASSTISSNCHLSQFKRPGCATPGWHLTFKQKGRTRTVYVPMSLVAEVKEWTRNYQRLKKRIREVTRHSLALVRSHVANQRAAKRSQALTRP